MAKPTAYCSSFLLVFARGILSFSCRSTSIYLFLEKENELIAIFKGHWGQRPFTILLIYYFVFVTITFFKSNQYKYHPQNLGLTSKQKTRLGAMNGKSLCLFPYLLWRISIIRAERCRGSDEPKLCITIAIKSSFATKRNSEIPNFIICEENTYWSRSCTRVSSRVGKALLISWITRVSISTSSISFSWRQQWEISKVRWVNTFNQKHSYCWWQNMIIRKPTILLRSSALGKKNAWNRKE